MASPFFDRLKNYYASVAAALRGDADASGIFPNPTDVGWVREQLYVDFLRNHLPSACNAKLGGFLFNQDGQESRQLDVIVTTDVCPQFNVHNPFGHGKSFACVDGTLAVVSIKSRLDSDGMRDVIENFASIPQHKQDFDWGQIGIDNPDMHLWPFKIVYAFDGVSAETLKNAMATFNQPEQTIPTNRLPDLVHVAGKFCIRRAWRDLQHDGRPIKAGTYFTTNIEVDIIALALVVERIQQLCVASRYVPYDYSEFVYRMLGMNPT